ncbi:hypothetical protein V6N11_054837 [Hibiscus sabdariffa]|uniref:F-box protein n=2 Tax=Hibiscus sabdariffa TaxID=183260 RepID=A0ABR2NB66_9ROSI
MKKQRVSAGMVEKSNPFDKLPDDLVVSILCNIGSPYSSPSDFFNTLMQEVSRFRLSLSARLVWSKLGAKDLLMVKAKNWSKSAQHFLMRCAVAGNVEAYYTLGMVRTTLYLSIE